MTDAKTIEGKLVSLRPSTQEDRRSIYEWLAHSDLTADMLGPPLFPDAPVPTWEEFLEDHLRHYFDGSAPRLGRCWVIGLGGTAIGQINYNDISDDGVTELDIWLSERQHTGKGYGTDAIETLCRYLVEEMQVRRILIAPSRRNVAALAAYSKAGFVELAEPPLGHVPDYHDVVVMERSTDSIQYQLLHGTR